MPANLESPAGVGQTESFSERFSRLGRTAGALAIAAISYPLIRLKTEAYRPAMSANGWRLLELGAVEEAQIIDIDIAPPESTTKPAA